MGALDTLGAQCSAVSRCTSGQYPYVARGVGVLRLGSGGVDLIALVDTNPAAACWHGRGAELGQDHCDDAAKHGEQCEPNHAVDNLLHGSELFLSNQLA